MTKLQDKLRHLRLFELMRQRELASHVSRKLRVSRLTDDVGDEAILLRTLATRSLTAPHCHRI